MDKSLASSTDQGSRWNWACVSSSILDTTVDENEDTTLPRIDEALEEEFMSILQQCNIYPETIDVPEMPYISKNYLNLDEESMHSSILDSTHIRGGSGIPEVLEFAVKSNCDFVPSKLRGWKSKRRTKAQPLSGDDSKSPLLNPDAIHNRNSLNMENVEEKWIKDWSDNDEQENKMHKMNRGMPKTVPFKIYTRP